MIKIHPLTGEITVEYDVGESGTRFVLDKHSSIIVGSGHGIFEGTTYDKNTYVIRGSIHSGTEWNETAVKINGDRSHIIVAKSGSLDGYVGASLNYAHETIVNQGDIQGLGCGVMLNAYSTVDNSGTIFGDCGIESNNKSVSITNDQGGIIKGSLAAVRFSGTDGQNTLTNDGMIKGVNFSVLGWDGVETIVNHGTIKGAIRLYGGDDKFDNRHGTIDSAIQGGMGDDTLTVDDNKTKLQEESGEGNDTVRSTVSYKLSTNVENLTLLGKHDINGTGTDEANAITGNLGDNTLIGKGGADTLNGMRGNDILSGGADADIFIFRKGTGHDVVTDFTHGEDHIDLSGFDGIVDFDEMVAHHLKVSGDDLIIRDGNDSVRLEHVAKTDIDFQDFYY